MKTTMRLMAAGLVALLAVAAQGGPSVTVSAGKFERTDTVASFSLPAGMDAKGNYGLVDGKRTIPVQLLPDGSAVFVVPPMKAGASLAFALESIPWATRPPLPTDLSIKQDGTSVAFNVGAKQMFRYNGDKTPLPEGYDPAYQRGGYLFPILTPSGRLVCDDYPPMHKHHHGLWFSWTHTEFEGRKPDFWNMGDKKGTTEFVELTSTFAGPVAAGLSARHRYLDLLAKPDPRVALNETWNVTAWGIGSGDKPYFVFDLVSTQTCAGDAPLKLPKYHYGGIAFRGHRDWNAKAKDAYSALTSEGKDRESANATTARWCHMGGKVDGAAVGLAILDHPANFRSPQPLRVHPAEPYFCFAPQVAGDFSIEPGKPYVSRYRMVVTDGEADKALLDRLWNDYASPPEVVVK